MLLIYKSLILAILISLLFSGCFGVIMLAGTAASTTLTVREIDKDYDGDILYYIEDKTVSLYDYLHELSED